MFGFEKCEEAATDYQASEYMLVNNRDPERIEWYTDAYYSSRLNFYAAALEVISQLTESIKKEISKRATDCDRHYWEKYPALHKEMKRQEEENNQHEKLVQIFDDFPF